MKDTGYIDVGISFVEEVQEELIPLLNAYWTEADERNDQTHSIDIETYKTLENMGCLVLVTAYDGEKLVGLLPYVESVCLHTGQFKAVAEMIYVDDEYRGQGIGSRMIDFMEGSTTAKHIYFSLKTYLPHNGLVLRNNYSHVENLYMKVKE